MQNAALLYKIVKIAIVLHNVINVISIFNPHFARQLQLALFLIVKLVRQITVYVRNVKIAIFLKVISVFIVAVHINTCEIFAMIILVHIQG